MGGRPGSGPVYPRSVPGRGATIDSRWPSSSPSSSSRRCRAPATWRPCGRPPSPTRSTHPTGCSSPPGAGTGCSRSSSPGRRREAARCGSWTRGARSSGSSSRSSRGLPCGWRRGPRCSTGSSSWWTRTAAPTTRPSASACPAGRDDRSPSSCSTCSTSTAAGSWASRWTSGARPCAGCCGRATRWSWCRRSRARAGRSTRPCPRRGSRACSRAGARVPTCRGSAARCGGRSWRAARRVLRAG